MRTIGGRTLGVALGVLVVAALTGATTGISTQQLRTAAPGAVSVTGVTAAEGTSLAVSRADHTHSLTGTLPQANGGTGAGALTCAAGQHLTSNGTAYSCITPGMPAFATAAGTAYITRPFTGVVEGAACTPNGDLTTDGSTNALVCRGLVWAKVNANTAVSATSATTATALSTAGAATQFWKNGNVWGQPAFTDISGTASTGQIPALPYLPVGGAAASANLINGAVVTVANHSATGTPGATTFYRGDNTWSVPAGTYVLPDATSLVTGGVRLTGDLGGTAASPTVPGLAGKQAAGSYSGVGACGANSWASTLTASSAPTCTQPAFSNISGTASTGQIPALPYLPVAGAAASANAINGAVVSLTTNVTGTLPIGNGGTNSTATPTAGGVGYGTGTAHAYTAAGSANQLMVSGGTGAPVFVAGATFAASTNTLSVSGPIVATGDITAYYSDARLKTNVRPISDPWAKLDRLRGVEWTWRQVKGVHLPAGDDAGLIAQEVQAVFPEAVGPNGDYLGLKVSNHAVVGLLVEAVKDLRRRVEVLESRRCAP